MLRTSSPAFSATRRNARGIHRETMQWTEMRELSAENNGDGPLLRSMFRTLLSEGAGGAFGCRIAQWWRWCGFSTETH